MTIRHPFQPSRQHLFIPDEYTAEKPGHTIQFSPNPDEPIKNYTIAEFETLSGMTYLPSLAFKSRKSCERVKRLCGKAQVAEKEKWLGAVYGKEIDQGAINDVYIRWVSDEMGYGCFAGRDIKKDEFIGEYTGLVRPCSPLTRDINEYCFRYPLYRTFFIVYTIDAKMQGNEMSFVNHSSSPNCEAAALWHRGLYHMCLKALEDIPKDRQLFFDYGNEKWRTFKK